MLKVKWLAATIVLFSGLLVFQNCSIPLSGPGSSTTFASSDSNLVADLSFVELDLTSAQELVDRYTGECARNQTLLSSAGITWPDRATVKANALPLIGSSELVSLVTGQGLAWVYGRSATARVDRVEAFMGKLFLCGMDLGSVSSDFNGDLLVDDGEILELSGKGNVIILGGEFPTIVKSFVGTIVVKRTSGEVQGRIYSNQ